jgi:hypothetical protein
MASFMCKDGEDLWTVRFTFLKSHLKRVPLPAEPRRDPFVNNTHTLFPFIEYRRLAYGAHYATGHSQVTCHVGNDRWQLYGNFKHRLGLAETSATPMLRSVLKNFGVGRHRRIILPFMHHQ